MLNATFKNCYGIRKLTLKQIDFTTSNKAIIYAPNGVMKTSFAEVFDDLKNKREPIDRIFNEKPVEYSIDYDGININQGSSSDEKKNIRAYVIKSEIDYNTITTASIGTLLANSKIQKEYEDILKPFREKEKIFTDELCKLSGYTSKEIEKELFGVFKVHDILDWDELFVRMNVYLTTSKSYGELDGIQIKQVLNDKTKELIDQNEFNNDVKKYNMICNKLIQNSDFITKDFDQYNSTELSKSIQKHNLFNARHQIKLKNGTLITDFDQWSKRCKEELDEIRNNPELNKPFQEIEDKLTKNVDTQKLRDMIKDNPIIISHLVDSDTLQNHLWSNYLHKTIGFYRDLNGEFNKQTIRLREIELLVKKENPIWTKIISDFNQRFNVPFKIIVQNTPKILLKSDPPDIGFQYCSFDNKRHTVKTLKESAGFLSNGERRALYLLHMLFDIEVLKNEYFKFNKKTLIIADDIADSFDYKNKYAIIEYLKEISDYDCFDLLLLTHNFDFYRTACSRIGIDHCNSYIVQIGVNNDLDMTKFGYHKDIFQNKVVKPFRSGQIDKEEKEKWLIASIPFYRNIALYLKNDPVLDKLTELLHKKKRTEEITLVELWQTLQELNPDWKDLSHKNPSQTVINLMKNLANNISTEPCNQVYLENKLILSMAIRLEAETLMKSIAIRNAMSLIEEEDQTGNWYERIKHLDLIDGEQQILKQVLLITPETLHLNTFMYEPIIDQSDWKLIELYNELTNMNEKKHK